MANYETFFKDKAVLITGGTGSFGRAFTKKLLTENQCAKVVIFSRDEWKQWEMRESDPIFRHPKIRFFLGDVRDLSRLNRAFKDINYVIHAAALKQVPAAEYNPSEFIKTNVTGAMNVIDAAIDCGVEKVIALSTDKAANPVNLYGATKLCSDKLFVAGNAYVGARGKPTFAVVRYGNVAASRGSVIPFWQGLLKDGAQTLPITDKRMTRFWITLDQSVDFVIAKLKESRGGELYVPKIPSVRITDIGTALDPKVNYEVTGIREGEKIHELMIGPEDARHTREFHDHFMIIPEIYTHEPQKLEKFLAGRQGAFLSDGFFYASDTNKEWLSIGQIRDFLKLS